MWITPYGMRATDPTDYRINTLLEILGWEKLMLSYPFRKQIVDRIDVWIFRLIKMWIKAVITAKWPNGKWGHRFLCKSFRANVNIGPWALKGITSFLPVGENGPFFDDRHWWSGNCPFHSLAPEIVAFWCLFSEHWLKWFLWKLILWQTNYSSFPFPVERRKLKVPFPVMKYIIDWCVTPRNSSHVINHKVQGKIVFHHTIQYYTVSKNCLDSVSSIS